jgi:hypothetical protein
MTTAQVFIAAYLLGLFSGMGWGVASAQKERKGGNNE